MEEAQKREILEKAKKVFFEAMLDGYAGGENRRSVKVWDEDGYKTITYTTEDGKYKVVDRYCETPLSDKSCGTTTIFFRTGLIWSAVWWMSYWGRYPKDIIPFLKSCLRSAYERGEFVGGRGPYAVSENNTEYLNFPRGSFSDFVGHESISPDFKDPLGSHKYSGMSML